MRRISIFMDYFEILPIEILLDILTRLPTESVLDCKLVSKTWNTLVNHPSFWKMHLHHLNHPSTNDKLGFIASTKIWNNQTHYDKFHYFEYNEDHGESTSPIHRIRRINLTCPFNFFCFVGSCNGLICLAREVLVWICNPITRECVMLSEIKRDSYNHWQWLYGFGYVSSTSEYKIVVIYYTSGDKFLQVYIYTLGRENGWRNLGEFSFKTAPAFSKQPGVFSDGAVYWRDDRSGMIITFDLAEERFSEHLSPPPSATGGHWWYSRIGVLDGVLYISDRQPPSVPQGGHCFDIWLLKKKSEDQKSSVWSKEFRVDKSILFGITRSDGVLTEGCHDLNIYYKETSTSKRLVKFKDSISKVFPHQNTFVSLKELGEKDTIQMESFQIEETKYSEQRQEDANPEYIYF